MHLTHLRHDTGDQVAIGRESDEELVAPGRRNRGAGLGVDDVDSGPEPAGRHHVGGCHGDLAVRVGELHAVFEPVGTPDLSNDPEATFSVDLDIGQGVHGRVVRGDFRGRDLSPFVQGWLPLDSAHAWPIRSPGFDHIFDFMGYEDLAVG